MEIADFFDGTIFQDVSTDVLQDLYKQHGIKDLGNVTMYHGLTGEKMLCKVFVAPNNYQRLQKFSVAAKYVVSEGRRDHLTKQLLASRSANGGSRQGEQEVVTWFSSGTAYTFKEKLFNCSDGQDLYVCKN